MTDSLNVNAEPARLAPAPIVVSTRIHGIEFQAVRMLRAEGYVTRVRWMGLHGITEGPWLTPASAQDELVDLLKSLNRLGYTVDDRDIAVSHFNRLIAAVPADPKEPA